MLIDRKLAACVTVITPVKSFYRWQGVVEKSVETQLMIKTSQSLFEAVSEAITSAHSYEVPELIAVPIVAGSPAYLAWLGSEIGE
jgi:periplasmic divalent cation tolerance protein